MISFIPMMLRQSGRDSGASSVGRGQAKVMERITEMMESSLGVMHLISVKGLVITAMLIVILLLSAIGVVYSSHLSRQLFAEQAILLERNDQLQLEWAQLLLEQSAWSSPNRIEAIAVEELDLVMPEVEQIELVY